MALSDNQKLDLMVRAYAEGYQGDFEELFASSRKTTEEVQTIEIVVGNR